MAVDLHGKKILIIEDHSEFGYHLRRMIKSLGSTDIDNVNNGSDLPLNNFEKLRAVPCSLTFIENRDGSGFK